MSTIINITLSNGLEISFTMLSVTFYNNGTSQASVSSIQTEAV